MQDHSEEGQGSSAKVVPVEESRRKNIVSEDLKVITNFLDLKHFFEMISWSH